MGGRFIRPTGPDDGIGESPEPLCDLTLLMSKVTITPAHLITLRPRSFVESNKYTKVGDTTTEKGVRSFDRKPSYGHFLGRLLRTLVVSVYQMMYFSPHDSCLHWFCR